MKTTPATRLGALAVALAAALCVNTVAAAAEGPEERIIVKIREGQGPAPAQAALDKAAVLALLTQAAANHGVSLTELRTLATGGHLYQVSGPHGALPAIIAGVRQDARIEYIEADALLQPNLTPTDSRYNEQWHYYEATAGLNLPPAWDQTTGTGARVAVLDTGYRPHADLAGNILAGYDMIADTFVSNDGNGRDSDAADPGDWTTANQCYSGSPATNSTWHGTHTSGTVAALTNNSTGVAGVGFNAKVVPVRVLGRCGGYISDISDGIIWASGGTVSGVPANANPAHAINMSLSGSGSCSSTLQSAINSARTRNTTVVVSAGNNNTDAAGYNPANCSGVITVAAVNRSGGKAYYSNYGSVVDVAAPGGSQSSTEDPNGILSTYNTGTTTPGADSYNFRQGTSMAAPHVAGAVALMYAKNTASTPDQIESTLKSTARAFPATCTSCGSGIVDASAAVAATANPPPPSSCPTGYTTYTGSISSGTSVYAPSGSGYVSSVSGTHYGTLSGPSDTNFDLYLQKKTGKNKWSAVASSLSASSTESITYAGTSGTYRWRLYAKSGSGSYTFCEKRP
jgi:serine protease